METENEGSPTKTPKSSIGKSKLTESRNLLKEVQTFIKSTIRKSGSPSKQKHRGRKPTSQKFGNFSNTRGGHITLSLITD